VDLSLTDEQQELGRYARAFLARRLGIEGVRRALDDETPANAEIWREGCRLGWSGLGLPLNVGGSGGGVTELMVLSEEFGRGLYSAPLAGTHLLARSLAEYPAAAFDDLLEQLLTGDATGTLALYDPGGAWWGSASDTTIAVSSRGYSLTGRKSLVLDGPAATHLLVFASQDDQPVLLVIPSSAERMVFRRQHTLDVTRRYYDVVFDGVRIDRQWLLPLAGAEASDWLNEMRLIACLLLCADGLGAAYRLVEITVEYAKQRTQFGRPIGSFQAIKHKCANLLMWQEAARAVTYAACAHLEERSSEAAEAISVAKAVCGELLLAVTSEALQCHGGIGMTWDYDLHLYLRRVRGMDGILGNALYHQQRLASLVGI
jgi:alkylation response protein AidB-like acyl-CoA dehydrogenase